MNDDSSVKAHDITKINKIFLLINNTNEMIKWIVVASPIAERSKSSDRGLGDPGSNPGEGRFFLLSFRMVN